MFDTIYNEDCLVGLKKVEANTVHLVITSPPYYLNKEYEKNITYEQYCQMMQALFIEIERVLIPGSYAVFNFGDYFNSGNRFYEADVPSCYPASLNYYHWGVELAKMDLQATRIWRKQFARLGIPFVCNTHPRPIFDYEHVWTFRKRNGANTEFVNDRKLSQRGVIGESWTTSAGLNKHCAAFPVDLPLWAIDVYSQQPGDLVLDPFIGSGTTAIAALMRQRHYLGFELNLEYYNLAQERIKNAK